VSTLPVSASVGWNVARAGSGAPATQILYAQLDALRRPASTRPPSAGWPRVASIGASRLLRRIPGLGPLRAALLLAVIQTPHRFRTKRQLWAYAGLALVMRTSADYHLVDGHLQKSAKRVALRGLNLNHNPT